MSLHAPPAADTSSLEHATEIVGAYLVPSNDPIERQRHDWLERFCGYLHKMNIATQAIETTRMLQHRNGAAVVVLPTWVWLVPLANVGERKSQFLLPARVTWDVPQVLALESALTANWTCEGLGYTQSGTLTIHPVDASDFSQGGSQDGATPLPSSVAAVRSSNAAARRVVGDLSEIGTSARWLALELLKPFVQKATDSARFSVASEIADNPAAPPVFDEIVRDRVVTELLYGYDGDIDGSTSRVWRMLDRCLEPGAFTKVDPMRYVHVAIGRDAIDATKRHLGDPRIGKRVRDLAREMNSRDVNRILERYRDLYPQDRIGLRRAEQALSAGADVSSLTVPIFPDEAEADR